MPQRLPLAAQEFADAWFRYGCSPAMFHKATGYAERAIYARRNEVEKQLGISLPSVKQTTSGGTPKVAINVGYHRRHALKAKDGSVVVFSDAHWWPGQKRAKAHEALLNLLPELKPRAVIANGDVFDGAGMSRHDPGGWEGRPSTEDELAVLQSNMREIEEAAGGAALLRTIGNHDIRFDKYLAVRASEMRGVSGSRLRDHLPRWLESWSVEINGECMVKHRWHQGIHATYNNTLKGGMSIVTAHMHRLQATAHTDYRGRRWGVDCGTLADGPGSPQFAYAEDNPAPWGSGFAVLTWRNGVLLPPEFCEVIKGKAWFRGEAV